MQFQGHDQKPENGRHPEPPVSPPELIPVGDVAGYGGPEMNHPRLIARAARRHPVS